MEHKANLIIVVINKGYSDLAMDAARKCGATGGTVLTARGTGNDEIEKFFGVPIHPEKEMVLIVVNPSITDKVLEAIYTDAGIETKGQGIVFTVPVDNLIGFDVFNYGDKEEDETDDETIKAIEEDIEEEDEETE